MDLDQEFPLKFYLNLGQRPDRRAAVEEEFARAGVGVERFPAVNGRFVGSARGFATAAKYACGLSKRLAVREAGRRGAPSLLLFEDDVVFHPEFRARVAAVELPGDWALFYLGCLHREPPVPVGPGLVRVACAVDNHAVGVRAPYFGHVMRALAGGGRGAAQGTQESSDVKLSRLHGEIPVYAAYPNLAWQRESFSDNQRFAYSNYSPGGVQLWRPEAVRGLGE